MNKFCYFAAALTIGYAIDAFTGLSDKSIDHGYNSELKAGNHGSMSFTRNEPKVVEQPTSPAEEPDE